MITENNTGAALLGTLADDDTAALDKLIADITARWAEQRQDDREGLSRLDAALWRTLQEAGLTALASGADEGAGPAELAVVLHGLARRSAPVPVAETDLLATWLAAQAGFEVSGDPLTVAIAETEESGRRVLGTACDVPWGSEIPNIVVAARGQDVLRVALVSADALDIEPHHNLAGESRDKIQFNLGAEGFEAVELSLLEELRLRGAWARCIQAVGAMDRIAELTMAHAQERVQFGRSLTKFQAVQHALAQMAGEIERARAAVTIAIAAAADTEFVSEQTRFAVYVAKVTAAQAVRSVNTIGHQLHGAIGVTIEHELWRSTMRAHSWVRDYGTMEHYARALGSLVLQAENPWALLTAGHCGEHQVGEPPPLS
jgi:acyl-CoA dehydrogenase